MISARLVDTGISAQISAMINKPCAPIDVLIDVDFGEAEACAPVVGGVAAQAPWA